VSQSVLRETQNLNTDPLVELWELDTSNLTNVYGEVGTGTVYRWTPGILNYRAHGETSAGSTATLVVLDQVLPIANTALRYTLQAALSFGFFSDPIPVTGFGTTTVGGNQVSTVGLASPLQAVPAPGTPWLVESVGTVFMGGVEYKPAPIEVTEMEWAGQGKLPKPKLRVSNIGGLAAALVIEYGDLVGAVVSLRRTFKKFLDGEANADPSAVMEPDIFVVDRKSEHTKEAIEFELAAVLDQQGIQLPRRLILRDSCDHTYRQWVTTGGGGHFVYGSCPYADESRFYTEADGAATTPDQDVCSKLLSGCMLRFGQYARLPFRGFPGVSEVRM
jgi:lambda family phage minor tail protein L